MCPCLGPSWAWTDSYWGPAAQLGRPRAVWTQSRQCAFAQPSQEPGCGLPQGTSSCHLQRLLSPGSTRPALTPVHGHTHPPPVPSLFPDHGKAWPETPFQGLGAQVRKVSRTLFRMPSRLQGRVGPGGGSSPTEAEGRAQRGSQRPASPAATSLPGFKPFLFITCSIKTTTGRLRLTQPLPISVSQPKPHDQEGAGDLLEPKAQAPLASPASPAKKHPASVGLNSSVDWDAFTHEPALPSAPGHRSPTNQGL